jgi:hypothetical protein
LKIWQPRVSRYFRHDFKLAQIAAELEIGAKTAGKKSADFPQEPQISSENSEAM